MIKTLDLNYRVHHDIRYFLAFGFGSGLMPFAPGTWGTLAAMPIYLILQFYSWQYYLAFVFIAFWVGVQLCQEITTELNHPDYPGIVWDECVGYWLTMFLVPFNIKWMLLGFVLFRFFDILKPPPIRQLDKKLQNGFGVMIDDVLAALMAWCSLQFIIWVVQ